MQGRADNLNMAVQPIFAGGQLPANVVTTQQLQRGAADAAPVQIAQAVQLQALDRRLDDDADRATTVLPDVGATPSYDVHARVEPVGDGQQQRGRLFDQAA